MPSGIKPMLATLVHSIPSDEDHFSFEFKWDGIRAITYWDGRTLRIESRNQLDITHRYPELLALGDAFQNRKVVLDGEIIALDEADRPSFTRLQRRMHVEDRRAIPRLVREVPICYLLFDVLYLDGRSIMHLPFFRRREMLEELTLAGPSWRLSPAQVGGGEAILNTARSQHLEGIVAKRLDSAYEPGRRSADWLKLKVIARAEFVIGGWVPEGLTNRSRVGTLLVGYYQSTPSGLKLRYAGGVGTGFDRAWHEKLVKLLREHARQESPFADRIPKPGALFVNPVLVAEVEYRRWPEDGQIQQAAFKGLRTDKPAAEVTSERVCT